MRLKLLPVLPAVLLAFSISHAYAAFDSDGNYYCNSSNLPLEEAIYKSSVSKIDSGVQNYLSLNPSASDRESTVTSYQTPGFHSPIQ